MAEGMFVTPALQQRQLDRRSGNRYKDVMGQGEISDPLHWRTSSVAAHQAQAGRNG
jgi:hypothetical protein